jgi:hypothetical protein
MPANTTPVFTLTPHISSARIATANANRDGTGTLGIIATGQANGTRIDRVTIEGTGVSTTLGMIRFFVDDGAGTIRLIKEIPVTAATPTATVMGFFAEWVRADSYPVEVLPAGYMLKASTHNAEQFDVVAHGGDF